MASSTHLLSAFIISLVVLTSNCIPIDSDASDAAEFKMNAEELELNHNDQVALSEENSPVHVNKRAYPTEGILLGKRQYPTEGILIGKRAYPTEGILLGKRDYPIEGILFGKREYPTEGILLGKRAYPTEGILLGKRNFRFFAPQSSGLAKY